MGRLFGTDGIRGVANVDLTPILAYDLGRAVGHLLDGAGRSVVVGQDTRRSGDMLVAALSAGLAAVGADVVQLGVVTTPCLAFVAARQDHAAGIMVSASHNPADDNGLKVVSGGRKVDDEVEEQLERLIFQAEALPGRGNAELGRIRRDASGVQAYRRHLEAAAGDALRGLRIAIDCANGSASAIAPELFTALGAEVTVLAAEPDGVNINLDCGSTHPEHMARTVRERGLDLGLAFDGDADRLIAADEHGRLVDGDAIMGICALQRLAAGTLRNGILVATVMSNGGLERAVREAGGRMLRTPVGDRHVFEAMERADAVLGGEQSGHVIFRDLATTGDGMLTAIELIKALRQAGGPGLGELADRIPRLPQVVINSAVRHKDSWQVDPDFSSAVARAEERLGARGRILVRPSGTEPKIRIMVEGEDHDEIAEIAHELDRLAQARLN
ncbi:MAG TPA: phosphoglucosamine mutase [candidate division Zixibacteria bacterium]|nr:phosphoglucosamine mutase [candidate division Zixibacteria bacterium]